MTNPIEINIENVQQELLDASQQKFILIDFWADWSEPSKQLSPLLVKIASEYGESLKLARINCDEQQQIAMQFGIKNLPTVVLFKEGQPLDGFAGVQTEAEIKAMLDKHLPKQQDLLFTQGCQLVEESKWLEAFPILKQVLELEPENSQFKLMYANVAIELGKVDEVEAILQSTKMADQDALYLQVLAKLDLAKQAAESPEVQALQQQLEAEPDSLELKLKLAVALHQVNRNEESLDLLFSVLQKDLGFADAKKTYLDIIASLPDGDVTASKYRRKIYALLY
ncbi:co-chaperone YbbN [Psychrosphaera sp. B3R10]|uniref:thioredoxin family protein n=1 Tax=unclassified Psychrosphaera TaxID=2641570 RepID=UPI001C096945|nr:MULTISPECIES: co-chaperone YbbN [unclassified Psychrosphaera]MBU2884124.1 co-chaperone YbbN [Psychrosphaera sp. I2R16]MBU2989630.1 co-chaperone YbbN [Psychrosphaera sp. B3R10]MDO6719339.1 co-chaperone YbbN [Psychrosphaera sp. 1_MG-2023]